jgi:hypothetical protein
MKQKRFDMSITNIGIYLIISVALFGRYSINLIKARAIGDLFKLLRFCPAAILWPYKYLNLSREPHLNLFSYIFLEL